MSGEDFIFAMVVFFIGIAMLMWIITELVKMIVYLAKLFWKGLKLLFSFITRILYWIFIAPWYYIFIYPFYRLFFYPSEIIVEKGLYDFSQITPKERHAHKRINVKYRLVNLFRKRYGIERRYKVKLGNDINILTHACTKEEKAYTVYMGFESSYSSKDCTFLFSKVQKGIPGYIIKPLVNSFNEETAYIDELTDALKFEDITSSYFMNKYPYLASLLMSTNIKRYDIPFLTFYDGMLSIVNPIPTFNAQKAIKNNDFSSSVILNAVNKTFEICECANHEYGKLIKEYNGRKQLKVKTYQKKKEGEWLKDAASIALKLGCKLLVSAAAGMVGANIDLDIPWGDDNLGDSLDYDINSLMNNMDSSESYYDNYDSQDLSYIYDISEIDQNITNYDESNITFGSQKSDDEWAEYYSNKADHALEQEQWHYDRAAKASENGDETAAKDHIARAKAWHSDAEKYLGSAKIYKK